MKVNTILNNYQYGSYAYQCLSSHIVNEERIDRNHVKVTWDNLSNSDIELLIKALGNKCLQTEDGLYIFKCAICGKITIGYGNNPVPVKQFGFCCDECNTNVVIPARLMRLGEQR